MNSSFAKGTRTIALRRKSRTALVMMQQGISMVAQETDQVAALQANGLCHSGNRRGPLAAGPTRRITPSSVPTTAGDCKKTHPLGCCFSPAGSQGLAPPADESRRLAGDMGGVGVSVIPARRPILWSAARNRESRSSSGPTGKCRSSSLNLCQILAANFKKIQGRRHGRAPRVSKTTAAS